MGYFQNPFCKIVIGYHYMKCLENSFTIQTIILFEWKWLTMNFTIRQTLVWPFILLRSMLMLTSFEKFHPGIPVFPTFADGVHTTPGLVIYWFGCRCHCFLGSSWLSWVCFVGLLRVIRSSLLFLGALFFNLSFSLSQLEGGIRVLLRKEPLKSPCTQAEGSS